MLYGIYYQGESEFDLSAGLCSVFDALETVAEWWKDKYGIPANDIRWINLTEEAALEDFTRHNARILLKVLQERFGYRKNVEATIMSKTQAEAQKEVEYIKQWLMQDDEKFEAAVRKVGFNSEALEIELYGRRLSKEEKEELLIEKATEAVLNQYGMAGEELDIDKWTKTKE